MANLSGSAWWRANQGRFPNSTSIDDLEPGFRSNVERFIDSLREAGASVVVSTTRRNATRAALMHYSWTVAYGETAPADVPPIAGVDIQWDHGDLDASRAAAMEMVKLFDMAYVAALRSNHIAGKAIDMTISWNGELVLRNPAPLLTRIASRPWSGQNRELQDVAATTFDVRKLRTDPPHWSYNGR